MIDNKLNILQNIGQTPLIEVDGMYAKLETFNPTGSVKDRMVWFIVNKAEQRGELKPGDTIVEATSGNTGISLAMISAIRGYHFIAVMPEFMSLERRKMIEYFGGKIILTPAKDEVIGTVKKYKQLLRQNSDFWSLRQFENPDNIAAHREGLGREIIDQTDGRIDAFVAAVGTGGTLIGVAQALLMFNPSIKIIAVEPEESAVLSGRAAGHHGIQGIGEGFIPEILRRNINIIDEVVTVSSREAIETQQTLARKFGLMVGISSGANMFAALKLKKRYKKIVTILPDRGERYLSI